MTTIDRTGASDAEFRARVAAFDAAPTPPECDPERVETVARAIAEHTQLFGGAALIGHPAFCSCGWEGAGFARHLAAAAIAALPPSPAEQAVQRVEAAVREINAEARSAWRDGFDICGEIQDRDVARIRAALASPAPAPQGEEGQR